MSGLEVLREVAEANAEAFEEAWEKDADGELREGVPVDMWRALR